MPAIVLEAHAVGVCFGERDAAARHRQAPPFTLESIKFFESCRGEIRFGHRNWWRSVLNGLTSFLAKFPELRNFFFLGVFFFLITLGVFALICLGLAVYFGCISLLRRSILVLAMSPMARVSRHVTSKKTRIPSLQRHFMDEGRVAQALLLFDVRGQTTKNRLTSLLLRLHYKILV